MTQTDAAQRSAPRFGQTVALAVTLGVAAFIPVLALSAAVTRPVFLSGFGYEQHQHAETLAYALTFLVVLPGVVLVSPRVSMLLEARLGAARSSAWRAILAGGLLLAILGARVIPDGGGGVQAALIADGAWALVALAAVSHRFHPVLDARLPWLAWPAVGVLMAVSLLAFTSLESISVIGLVIASITAAAMRFAPIPRLPRRAGRAADVAVVVLLGVAIPELVVFTPAGSGVSFADAFDTRTIQFHQDFFMGPANVVLHGGAMLVDTASQYGVGSIYAVAGWFQLVPLGYGQLALLDALLYVLYFVAGYVILRLAGTRRGLASLAVGLAVPVLLYNLTYPVGALLQHGPLRFGIPMVVIAAAVASARERQPSRRWIVVQCTAVGLASIWALEAFAATTGVFVALSLFRSWEGLGGRLRGVSRDLLGALAACVACHLFLALATLGFRGHWPDWGDYLAFLREFLAGSIGDITYDFTPWSAGLAVGAGIFTSAAGFGLLARLRRDLLMAHRPLATALFGTSVFSALLFYYFVDRSADHILPYVSFPLVLSGVLWISLLRRVEGDLAPPTRWALGLASVLAVLLSSVAWSSIGTRFSQTPLGELAPGGDSLGTAFSALWNLPPLNPATPKGEALLARYAPGDGPVAMVLNSDLQEELLIRAGRADSIPFGDPVEDSFAGTRFVGDLIRGVDRLGPGTRVLISTDGVRAIRLLRASPRRDPLTDPISTPDGLTGEQERVLVQLAEHFRYRVIHRDSSGYAVLELGPLRAST